MQVCQTLLLLTSPGHQGAEPSRAQHNAPFLNHEVWADAITLRSPQYVVASAGEGSLRGVSMIGRRRPGPAPMLGLRCDVILILLSSQLQVAGAPGYIAGGLCLLILGLRSPLYIIRPPHDHLSDHDQDPE